MDHMWIRTCLFKLLLSENVSHLYGLFRVDTDIGFQLPIFDNCAPQVSHLYGLSRVDTDVDLQTTTVCELCTTGITFEWFLTSVDTDMYLQITTT